MSDLFVDNIKHQSSQGSGTITLGASGETIALASGATAGFGKVGQVQSTFYNTPTSQSVGGNTDTSITGINVAITPSSTSSKILLFARFFGEGTSTNYWNVMYFFRRGTTKIGAGVASGNRLVGSTTHTLNYFDSDKDSTPDPMAPLFHLDSPATTSEITYHLGINASDADYTLYINRTVSDSNTAARERGSCEITAMEILP